MNREIIEHFAAAVDLVGVLKKIKGSTDCDLIYSRCFSSGCRRK
ncbi:hypothetical protein [Enterococcus hulanensis]|nr:hypothetical protein [Enterococcus hulanensis]